MFSKDTYHYTITEHADIRIKALDSVQSSDGLNPYKLGSHFTVYNIRAASSGFVSSSIPSRQILTAHAQPFRWARDLALCLKIPLDSMLV